MTSAGWIMLNSQKDTPFVATTRMDAELNVSFSPGILNNGKPSRDKKRQAEVIHFQNNEPDAMDEDQSRVNTAERIVLARLHPGSDYNQETGGHWALPMPSFGSGRRDRGALFWKFVKDAAERMVRARHSSGHFLQAGFKFAVKSCFSSPLFRHARKYRGEVTEAMNLNVMNRLDTDHLGGMQMTNPNNPSFSITVMNNVGDQSGSGNAILDAKHRAALMQYALPNVEKAVQRETAACEAELARRMADGLVPIQKMLD